MEFANDLNIFIGKIKTKEVGDVIVERLLKCGSGYKILYVSATSNKIICCIYAKQILKRDLIIVDIEEYVKPLIKKEYVKPLIEEQITEDLQLLIDDIDFSAFVKNIELDLTKNKVSITTDAKKISTIVLSDILEKIMKWK